MLHFIIYVLVAVCRPQINEYYYHLTKVCSLSGVLMFQVCITVRVVKRLQFSLLLGPTW